MIVRGTCFLGLCASLASAQTETQQGSSDTSASASLEASGAESSADTNLESTGKTDAESELPYIYRYKPEANTWEVGLFTGVFLPSAGVQLYSPRMPYQSYDGAAFELGARLAYFPTTFLGVEGEFMMADGRVPNDLKALDSSLVSNRANFFSWRGHVVAQLPFWSVVPFVLVGGGAIGVNSQPLGRDIDGLFHFGVGAKVALSRDFSLRAEFRENITERVNENYGGVAFNEELLLGATFTFGRARKAVAPAPLPDRDGDSVPDDQDACPEVGALTSDGCPADTDGDGLPDPDDYCPREAGKGLNGCPDPDTDKDGVPLPCDACPDEEGVAPDGCPIRDKDGDGVLDDKDKCPAEPETKNGFEDDDGCPDEIPKEVEKFTGSIAGIQFVQGSAQIQKGSDKALSAAADVLKKFPSVRLEISGHTSSEGDASYNQKLSEDRAAAVRQWFLDDGIAEDRLTARGAGSSEPLGDNATAAGRAKNRRIEFRILTQ